jgi:hypothetical protein
MRVNAEILQFHRAVRYDQSVLHLDRDEDAECLRVTRDGFSGGPKAGSTESASNAAQARPGYWQKRRSDHRGPARTALVSEAVRFVAFMSVSDQSGRAILKLLCDGNERLHLVPEGVR